MSVPTPKAEADAASTTALAGELVRRLVPREALLLGGFAVVLLVAGGAAVWAGSEQIHHQVDAGLEVEAAKREVLAEQLRQHIADEAAAREAQRRAQERLETKVDEGAADMRALYRAMRTGQAQERLEHPPPPAPDGGKP